MRIVTVDDDGRPRGGVLVRDGGIAALERWGSASVEDLIAAGPDKWAEVEQLAPATPADWPPDHLLRSPVTRTPRNIFCIGVNYVTHYDEGERQGVPMPEKPVIFTKAWTTLIGPTDDIVVDRSATDKVDWEAELAVVIGVGGVNIPEDEAMQHVFGFSLANDVSARDLQQANGPFSQWHKGKSLDGFCPLGPWIAHGSSFPGLESLRVQLFVNGTLKQDFRPGEMYHSVSKLISYLSKGMALLPGDVILTGTAAGVGLWQSPPQFLVAGDEVEIRCDGLGTMRNRVVEGRH